jgi:hypothetical protein
MSDLATRMRSAANTLEELSTLYGYRHPIEAAWSAHELRHELRHEADILDTNTPHTNWDNCSGATADLGDAS